MKTKLSFIAFLLIALNNFAMNDEESEDKPTSVEDFSHDILQARWALIDYLSFTTQARGNKNQEYIIKLIENLEAHIALCHQDLEELLLQRTEVPLLWQSALTELDKFYLSNCLKI